MTGAAAEVRSDVWAWLPDDTTIRVSPGDGVYMQACVHPAGDEVVYWGGPPNARPRLWWSPTDRSDPVPMTPTDSGARHGSFGLGGDRVVFSADSAADERGGPMGAESAAGTPPSGHWNLFSMAIDGSDLRQVTRGPWVDQRPALSPDGATIAFVPDRGPGIWLVDADGSRKPRHLGDGAFLYRPAWSLDGRSLFAFRMTRQRRQVGSVSLDSGAFTPLDNDDRGNTHGPWPDPSGDRLIVHSDRSGAWRLWEVPLDGSPMAPLRPPGHADDVCAHGTRGRNGVLTFDRAAMVELTRS